MRILRSLGFAIVTVVLYLRLPLIGLGLGDLAGYFSLAPRAGYALIVGLAGLVVGWQAFSSPEGIHGGDGQTGRLVPRQRVVELRLH